MVVRPAPSFVDRALLSRGREEPFDVSSRADFGFGDAADREPLRRQSLPQGGRLRDNPAIGRTLEGDLDAGLSVGSLRFAHAAVTAVREGLGRVCRDGDCRLAADAPPSAALRVAGTIAGRVPKPFVRRPTLRTMMSSPSPHRRGLVVTAGRVGRNLRI
jgi:hypothetical protein